MLHLGMHFFEKNARRIGDDSRAGVAVCTVETFRETSPVHRHAPKKSIIQRIDALGQRFRCGFLWCITGLGLNRIETFYAGNIDNGGLQAEFLFLKLYGLKAKIEGIAFVALQFKDFNAKDTALSLIAPKSPMNVRFAVIGTHFGGGRDAWR